MVIQEGEAEISKGKNLWDPSLDTRTFLEKALLPTEERERLMTHDENHLVREAIRQFGQALARSCLTATKMKERKAAEDLKAQEISELRKEMEHLQSELQYTKDLQQEDERHLAETKEATSQAQDAAKERSRLFSEIDKLKGELVQKDEYLTKETEACKQDAAQSYLVGFEAAIEQASGLHPEIDYSQLNPGKTVVNGQLRDE